MTIVGEKNKTQVKKLTCTKCGQSKWEYAFRIDTRHRTHKRKTTCIECERLNCRAWRRNNKKYAREYGRHLYWRRRGIYTERPPRQHGLIPNWQFPAGKDANKLKKKHRDVYTLMKTHYEATGINLSLPGISRVLNLFTPVVHNTQLHLIAKGYIQSPKHNPILGDVVCPKCGFIIRRNNE